MVEEREGRNVECAFATISTGLSTWVVVRPARLLRPTPLLRRLVSMPPLPAVPEVRISRFTGCACWVPLLRGRLSSLVATGV